MEQLILNLIEIVGNYGYLIIFLIIFFESFPMTFFLPGDSLLFTTGFLASQGHFDLVLLISAIFVAGTSGYFFSYYMGERLRNFILRSNDSYWFKKKHLDYTQDFYDRHGDKTLIIGRFVPIIRSFSAMLAGSAQMPYKRFTYDNIAGGAFWAVGMTSFGYYLGKSIPGANLYLTPIIFTIIFVSFLPTIYEYIKERRSVGNKNISQ